jgi:hypothetical protein
MFDKLTGNFNEFGSALKASEEATKVLLKKGEL